MKYPIIFSMLFFASVYTVSVKAQNTQTNNQPQGTPDYPVQKNGESEQPSAEKKQPLTAEQKAQKQADYLQKKLGLTEEQKAKAYDLSFARVTQMKALRDKNKGSDNKQGSKEEIQKIRTDYDSGLTGIMNDDQQKIWTQMKADAKAKKDAHHAQKGSNSQKTADKPAPTDADLDDLNQ